MSTPTTKTDTIAGLAWTWTEDPETGFLEADPLVKWSDIADTNNNLKKEFIPKENVRQIYDRVFQNKTKRAYEIELCRRDTWRFLKDWVWTFDKMDPKRPIKRYPEYEYLQAMSKAHDDRRWERNKTHPHILTVKPRAVLYSYQKCGEKLSAIMFEDFYSGYMSSIKLNRVDDGGKRSSPNTLFGKIRIMYRLLPKWMQDYAPLDFNLGFIRNLKTGGNLRAEVSGEEIGVALSADSGMLDEAGLMPRLSEQIAVAEPQTLFLDVGGTPRAAGSGFHQLVEDTRAGKTSYQLFELDWWWIPERRACTKCGSSEYAEDGATMRDRETGDIYPVMIKHTGRDCRPQDGCYYDELEDRWTSPWFRRATMNMSEEMKRREFERDFYRAVEGKVFKMLQRRQHVIDFADWKECTKQRVEGWDHGYSDNTAIFHAEWDGKKLRFLEYYERSGETAEFYCKRKAWLHGEFWTKDANGRLKDCWLSRDVYRLYERLWGPPNRHVGYQVKFYGDPSGDATESDAQSWHKRLRRGAVVQDLRGKERTVGRIRIFKAPSVGLEDGLESCKWAIERGRVVFVRNSELAAYQADAETGYNRVSSYHRRVDDSGAALAHARPVHDMSSHAADAMRYAILRTFGVRKHALAIS